MITELSQSMYYFRVLFFRMWHPDRRTNRKWCIRAHWPLARMGWKMCYLFTCQTPQSILVISILVKFWLENGPSYFGIGRFFSLCMWPLWYVHCIYIVACQAHLALALLPQSISCTHVKLSSYCICSGLTGRVVLSVRWLAAFNGDPASLARGKIA